MAEQLKTVSKAKRNKREVRTGTVVSKSGDKSLRVRFDYMVRHPKYGKYLKRRTTLSTHDSDNQASVGDLVEVMSCRRMSKTKCWVLKRIVRSA